MTRYIESIENTKPKSERNGYPYNIPSIVNLDRFTFRKPVTFIVGENGSGKSTFIEAIAIKAGFNPEGGSRNFNFSTSSSHSDLFENIKLRRGLHRFKDGYFLRAESFYNVASEVDKLYGGELHKLERAYGGSLHTKSHGESFLALLHNRLSGNGLYIFDEPESALSINSQLNMLVRIKELVEKNSQFIIATHSPILLAYPDSEIYQISDSKLNLVKYEDTEQFTLTKLFINSYQKFIDELKIS